MARYALVGAAGQLGRDLAPRLGDDVVRWGRDQAELTNLDLLRASLAAARPDVVINCAAYNFVDKAESEPEAAFAVNAWGVRNLALACRDLDITLVHFSSDYVFGLDAARTTPFAEGDAPGPVSVYGNSKLAGEYLVRAICPKHFVDPHLRPLRRVGQRRQGRQLRRNDAACRRAGETVARGQRSALTPSYTVDVSAATAAIIATQRYGLYHLTNAGSCSWFDFAAKIFELSGVKADLSPTTSCRPQRSGASAAVQRVVVRGL